ncbi:MAG: phytanoyl-CoA dioxygenase [Pseudonocardia sp. SCN 72-86]|nr:MAG: phytanoyl-CoA dioxygenase [Pseudonocardia sp. SCN 72-86]
MLTDADVDRFVADGFVHLPAAFPADVAAACRELLWAATGCDPSDPATWTRPVVRIPGMADPPFRVAANTPELHSAFDRLAGPGRWVPRSGLGTFPIRFPHADDPGDAGWHVEASWAGPDGSPRLDLRSRGRALLMLFLFSEVGEDDAPTRLRVGSHLDVPTLLEPHGDDGADFFALAADAIDASEHRPVALATGSPGDVYLVHPFVVHCAQPHRGTRPRFMAQPPLDPTGLLDLSGVNPTPVEQAVVAALRASRSG